MSKKWGNSFFQFAMFFGVATAFFLLSTKHAGVQKPFPAEASKGDEDDPNARQQYEWMMLRDPGTEAIPPNIRQQELAFAKTLPTRESLARLGKGAGVQALTWTSRGPYNVGGRTRALAIDISNENTILAGGVSGGMWRSTNGGTSWTRTTSLTPIVQSATCLTQDVRAGKQTIWYYGTGEYLGNSAAGGSSPYHGDGIFKSTNGGVTWNILPSTATNRPESFDNFFDYVWSIAVNSTNTSQDEVYAATYGLIQRSTDGGTSWADVLGATSPPYSNYTDIAITAGGAMYASLGGGGSQDGIYRSTDGINWTNITPAGFPFSYRRIVIGLASSNQNAVYFLAQTPGTGTLNHQLWKYTYVSGNGSGAGGTWSDRSANMPAFGGSVGNFDSQNSYDLIVKVKPDNENIVFVGGTNLYRSTDGFATSANTTWVGGYATVNDVSQYANHHPDQHSLTFLPSNPSVLFSGHDGGISKTTNDLASSVNWTVINNGYLTTQFYSVALDHGTSGNNVIIGGLQDNGNWFTNSTNSTTSWVEIPGGGDGTFCAVANGRTSYYFGTQNGNVLRMLLGSDGSFQNFTKVTPAGASGFLFVAPYVLDPNDSKRMYMAAGGTIWRNTDLTAIPLSSNNKTSVNWDSLAASYVSGGTISALTVSTTPANRLYFGTTSGQVYRMDGVNVGTPNRMTITGAGFPSGAYVSCITVDPSNADNAIVVFSNYNVQSLFATTDGGATWSAVGGNLEPGASGPSVRWAAIVPSGSSKTYFVATSVGIYSTNSLNGSSTVWAQEGASTIGNVVTTMIDSRASDGVVAVATHANGVYSAAVSAPSSVERLGNGVPNAFTLAQNYPNPFNPSTTVRFDLPRDSHVRINVFDITGKELARLVDETKSAGSYVTQWDGRDSRGVAVSSGTYFYRLETQGYTSTKKMVLLK
ncbi:MAG: T9SS type A sorting domain-containing protein [Ignavibacteriales bacterium]|nr:T9SS type A sorting domain-containing protein [Ignavibacteriales bacterium]